MSPLLRPITLERQLGQLLLVGFRGVTPAAAAPFLQKMAALNFGGVVLFDVDVPSGSPGRNIESPTQLRKLTAALQEAAPTPLLIAVDQEGGRVARLNPERGFPPTVSHQELGSRDCLSHTRRSAGGRCASCRRVYCRASGIRRSVRAQTFSRPRQFAGRFASRPCRCHRVLVAGRIVAFSDFDRARLRRHGDDGAHFQPLLGQ